MQAIAQQAALALAAELRRSMPELSLPGGGKMFGVLVAKNEAGELFTLRAFSGQLGGRWLVDGYAPPLFDRDRRARVEIPGEAKVKALLEEQTCLEASPERAAAIAALEKLRAYVARSLQEMTARHHTKRANRRAQRAQTTDAAVLHALDQESRGDKAERRRHDAEKKDAERAIACVLTPIERRLRALERVRRLLCAELMRAIHETYVVTNASGEERALRSLFAPHEPPSGAGDCAAPKLLAEAHARGLETLAIAEIFVGDGARSDGALCSPCAQKCEPLLAFMLGEVRGPQAFTVIYEDETLIVVDKASGVLSVPGKHARDSVLTRLQATHPQALLVHRLDQDTSGLLVACKDAAAYRALQRQFAERKVEKRYAAIVAGAPATDQGRIELPLRLDPSDRPRQIHDPLHGKAAVTEWRVIDRGAGRTRIAFLPRTGRTHQLRVHAALGLGAPIVGDRLYGNAGERLLLHAEALAFTHPRTGVRVEFSSAPPF